MSDLTILLIALALAVDAFVVALAAGVSLPRATLRHTFRLAWHFGFFQGGMTFLGWAGGIAFRSIIESFDHWLAFSLLLFVGARMIYEAFKNGGEKGDAVDPTRGFSLILLSVATSIDALAVGLSFAFLQIKIVAPILVIGIVALFLTATGLHLGGIIRNTGRLGSGAEIGGGLVLILIGFRILCEHGVFCP